MSEPTDHNPGDDMGQTPDGAAGDPSGMTPPPPGDMGAPPPPPGGDLGAPPPPPGAAGAPPADGQPPRVGIGADGSLQASAPPPSEESLWQRIPVAVKVIVPIIAVVAVIGFITAGQTNAEDLKPGDCFQEPSGDEFRSVEDQSCDELHESEILATVNMPPGTPWPGADFSAIADVETACFNAIDLLTLNEDNIPLDAELGYFFTERSGWEDGELEILCYVTSRIGLSGPVLVG